MPPVQLLLVEEEDPIRALLQKLLRREGYAVAGFGSAAQALAHVRDGFQPQALLCNPTRAEGRAALVELARHPIWQAVPLVDTAGDLARIADRVAEAMSQRTAAPTDLDTLEYVAQTYGQMAAQLPSLLERLRELAKATGQLDQIEHSLAQAERGGRHTRSFVRYLRDYGRIAGEERVATDPRRALEMALETADLLLMHSALLEVEISGLPTVMADERRLGHVFLSLLVNAAQAIGRGAPEKNRVRVQARIDEHGWLIVDVIDSGCGMSPQVLSRVFEPYFTTKEGAGLGLGLFQSRAAVAAWGGTISCVATEPGRGSTFRVELPPAAPRMTAR
jgi:signal transduction histidine kinase